MATALVILVSAIAFSACASDSQEKYYLEERVPGASFSFHCSTSTSLNQFTVYRGTKLSSKNKVLHLFWKRKTDVTATYEPKYENRTSFSGSSKEVSVNITNLTEEDSGVYWCQYYGVDENANVMTLKANETVALLVKRPVLCPVLPPNPTNPTNPTNNFSHPNPTNFIVILISIITAVIVFLMFAIMLTFFVIPKIKKLKAAQATQNRGNDSVYEVMSATLRRT